jgi:hypothetical protein
VPEEGSRLGFTYIFDENRGAFFFFFLIYEQREIDNFFLLKKYFKQKET